MTDETMTTIQLHRGIHQRLRDYANARGMFIYRVLEEAIAEYISSRTHADMTQARAASDPIGEGRQG